MPSMRRQSLQTSMVGVFSCNFTYLLIRTQDLHWSEKEQMYCDLGLDPETDESIHHCHRGYVSLFPLLLGLLPASSPRLGAILDLMHSPDHLWSNYGLRSLSAQHPKFLQDENYWRGNIWININYMALRSLHEASSSGGALSPWHKLTIP
jgi:mannosyl-oligosaccharide glucosidase